MQEVLDTVAAHKADVHAIADQLGTASPSGVETLMGKLRAAVVLLENDVASIFERARDKVEGKPAPFVNMTKEEAQAMFPDPSAPAPETPKPGDA